METFQLNNSSNVNKTLMVVFPHPDDETFGSGGLLCHAKKMGWKTIVVSLTKGGAGKIFVHGHGRSVVEIREQELLKAGNIFCVDELVMGDFNDSQLVRQEQEWVPWVKALLEKYNPGIVVTYDHSGLTAHPDHIILSLRLTDIVKKLKHKPQLFWVSMAGEFFKRVVDKRVVEFVSPPTHTLNLTVSDRFKKFRAFLEYKSQFPKSRIPAITAYIFKRTQEWYHMVDLKKNYKYKFVEFKL